MHLQRHTRANVVIFSVEGQLDATTAPSLEGALQAESQAGVAMLIIELGQVQTVSSAALRVLVSAAKQTRRENGRIALCVPNPEVKKVFSMSGLSNLLELYPSMSDALAAFGVVDEAAGPSPAEPAQLSPAASSFTDPADGQSSAITVDMPPQAVRGEAAVPSVEPLPTPGLAAGAPSTPEPADTPAASTPPPLSEATHAPSERMAPPPPPPVRPPPTRPTAAPASRPMLAALLADPQKRPALLGAAGGVIALVLILIVAATGHRHAPAAVNVGASKVSVASTPPPPASTPADSASPDALVGTAIPTPAQATEDPSVPPSPTETPGPGAAVAETVNVPPPGAISLDADTAENQQMRAAVLKRIDLMPVSPAQRDRLYQSLDRAHGLGKIITIPFANNRTDLSGAVVNNLKAALERPDIAHLLSDPATVVVVLGFADPKGNPQVNKDTSTRRAEHTVEALRGPCAVPNVMHAVGMGGSGLLDQQHLEKNRVVEVWAVLP